MATRPIIGITTDHNTLDAPAGDSAAASKHTQYLLPHAYAAAVERAGGVPVVLPYKVDLSLVPAYADLCAGFVFSGGNDYDPAGYGEELHPRAVPIDPFREKFERALMAEVERRRRPALGICGGCQVMNLSRGGSLHQFIPDLGLSPTIEHRRFNLDEWATKRHSVRVEPDSVLARVTGSTRLITNSSHKQSVNRPGRGLRVVAWSDDGVIEGVEDATLPFFVGVQWHPERLADEPEHLRLFQRLVELSHAR